MPVGNSRYPPLVTHCCCPHRRPSRRDIAPDAGRYLGPGEPGRISRPVNPAAARNAQHAAHDTAVVATAAGVPRTSSRGATCRVFVSPSGRHRPRPAFRPTPRSAPSAALTSASPGRPGPLGRCSSQDDASFGRRVVLLPPRRSPVRRPPAPTRRRRRGLPCCLLALDVFISRVASPSMACARLPPGRGRHIFPELPLPSSAIWPSPASS